MSDFVGRPNTAAFGNLRIARTNSILESPLHFFFFLVIFLHECRPTHRMCIRAVGAEGEGDGWVKDAKLSNHLLHASDGALLVCVCKLDHQAGGGTLRGQREQKKK